MNSDASTHSGFAAVIGAPNAGKSTLVNRLVGMKISIVTQKVQTTRFPVRGVMMRNNVQIVLMDTPGIFAPKRRLDRAMVRSAWEGAEAADAVVHIVDANVWSRELSGSASGGDKKSLADDQRVVADLKSSGRKALLALNKIDLFDREALLPITERLFDAGVYSDAFMISGLKGDGVDALSDQLAEQMPPGPYLFPEDQIADAPLQLLAAEITREKLMLRLHQELPYQLTVETEAWEPKRDGSVVVRQVIYVAREGHRKIILGKGGRAIKDVGRAAREDIAQIVDRPIHLFTRIKVSERWTENRERFAAIGLEFDV